MNTAAVWVERELARRLNGSAPTDRAVLRRAVGEAAARVLENPRLPGEWFGEQIVRETIKILSGDETK